VSLDALPWSEACKCNPAPCFRCRINLGSASVTCPITITVIQSALPPTIANSVLFTIELMAAGALGNTCSHPRPLKPRLVPLVPAGSVVGSLGGMDPANYTITNYTWVSIDANNNFNVSNSGVVAVAAVVDTLGECVKMQLDGLPYYLTSLR